MFPGYILAKSTFLKLLPGIQIDVLIVNHVKLPAKPQQVELGAVNNLETAGVR